MPRVRPDTLSWALIGGLLFACLAAALARGFGVLPGRAALCGAGLAVLAGAVEIGRRRTGARLTAGATAFLQMTLFTVLGVVLTYGLAARAAPLWDARLAAADRRLGVDWPALLAAADQLPAAALAIGGVAYYSLIAQMVLCIVVLAATGRLARLRVMVAAAILSGVATVLLSGVVPAIGQLFDPAHYRALWPSVAWQERLLVAGLRDGSVRQIDLLHLTGIVSFPSYHATLPVVLAWGLYPIARLRVAAACWATLTIAATPVFGGHYVVDVLGGLGLAVAALSVVVWLTAEKRSRGVIAARLRGRRPQPAAALKAGHGTNGRMGHDVR